MRCKPFFQGYVTSGEPGQLIKITVGERSIELMAAQCINTGLALVDLMVIAIATIVHISFLK
jgi:hypothetical protein